MIPRVECTRRVSAVSARAREERRTTTARDCREPRKRERQRMMIGGPRSRQVFSSARNIYLEHKRESMYVRTSCALKSLREKKKKKMSRAKLVLVPGSEDARLHQEHRVRAAGFALYLLSPPPVLSFTPSDKNDKRGRKVHDTASVPLIARIRATGHERRRIARNSRNDTHPPRRAPNTYAGPLLPATPALLSDGMQSRRQPVTT